SPIWREIDRRGLPVLVHPTAPAGTKELDVASYNLIASVGFMFDTSLAVSRMIFDGFFERYPNLKLIAAHGGGALPYIAGRLDICFEKMPACRERISQQPSFYLKKIYYDSVVFQQESLQLCIGAGGEDRVLHVRAAELARQMMDVARPLAVRLERQPFSFGVRFGDDHVQRPGEEWRRHVRVVAAGIVPVLLPELAVALEKRLAVCEPSEERRVIAVPRGELDGIAVAAGEPEGWIRLLHRLVVKLHVLALVVEDIAAAGSKENVERLAVAGARLLDAFQSISQGFDGRDAATHAKLEPAARELVEHADFVVEAVRVIPGQAEDERTQAQAFRALDHRREQHARRGVDRERRALVLGEQVGVKAGAVGRGCKLELVLVHLAGRA